MQPWFKVLAVDRPPVFASAESCSGGCADLLLPTVFVWHAPLPSTATIPMDRPCAETRKATSKKNLCE